MRRRCESSSHTSCKNEIFDDFAYPRHCDLCQPLFMISDPSDFARHLRRIHSTKEGGSFVCRYGPNGVCQTLPLEGVSDRDYAAHIRKCHTNFDGKCSLASQEIVRTKNLFTINSFTQNLSSVLSDPKQSRYETQVFFTRHWGDSFIVKNNIAASPLIPSITAEHFKNYLNTIANKRQNCLKVKNNFWLTYNRYEQNRTDVDDVPTILLNPYFSLADPETFDSIFLEPKQSEPDCLLVNGTSAETSQLSICLHDRTDERISQLIEPFRTEDGRRFRSYHTLQQRLESYHDLVDSRLNNQLASKSNAFWKTVVSYSGLHSELADAINKILVVRKSLQLVNEKICGGMMKIVELYKNRQRNEQLLHKLQDMACLRAAQTTVQMLLNQSDFPKALECIETAQDVLASDLRGVLCFRHLNSQLQELRKMIDKVLHEEFIALITKELGRSCETEADASYQGDHLNPVVLGLMRLGQYRFVSIIQQEIVEDLKNSFRQILKSHVIINDADRAAAGLDSSSGNLNIQICSLNFDEWFSAFDHVLRVSYYKCRRMLSLQKLLIENIDRYQKLNKPITVEPNCDSNDDAKILDVSNMFDDIDEIDTKIGEIPLNLQCTNGRNSQPDNLSETSNVLDSPEESKKFIRSAISTPLAILSMPCRNLSQVRQSLNLLAEYTANCAEERICKLLVARSKDGSLECLSVAEFQKILYVVNDFIEKCRSLVNANESYYSPLRLCIVQRSSSFIKKFHEDRRIKLGIILDSENWRANDVPEHFVRLVNEALRIGKLRDIPNFGDQQPQSKQQLIINGENFVVVSTALILLQMMGQYCDILEVLPDFAIDLLMCLVELLKNYNSRSCQLILGAGALQLIGLKSISVRHLALSSRSLQLILLFIPYVKAQFNSYLDASRSNHFRYLDQIMKDYSNHIQEILNKLIGVIDHHLVVQLQSWEVKAVVPSPAFMQIFKHLKRFYNGLVGVMPEAVIKELFLRVHENFKRNLKEYLDEVGITPHDSLTYGLVSQEYLYYLKSLQSLGCCCDFKDESISEALYGHKIEKYRHL